MVSCRLTITYGDALILRVLRNSKIYCCKLSEEVTESNYTSFNFALLLSAIRVRVCTKYWELHDEASSAGTAETHQQHVHYTSGPDPLAGFRGPTSTWGREGER